jgi:hypothetical protein
VRKNQRAVEKNLLELIGGAPAALQAPYVATILSVPGGWLYVKPPLNSAELGQTFAQALCCKTHLVGKDLVTLDFCAFMR